MKLSTIIVAGMAVAGAATLAASAASAAQVFESYAYSGSSGSIADSATLYVTNNSGSAYSDVKINGQDMGSLAASAQTAGLNVGDPSEGASQYATVSFTQGGVTTTERVFVNDIDSPSGQVQLTTTAVTEPATWGLMVLGLGGLGVTLRSSRRTKIATA